MLFRRFAAAIALLVAGLASQLPEYTQQYRQRLGGAIDELTAMIEHFDADAASQSLSREQGIARLKANRDPLAQGRGADVDATIQRADRLERQRDAFATAGPLSQYAVLVESFDPGIAARAYADFQPAIPVTISGFIAAAFGLLFGWLTIHVLAWPFRRHRRPGFTDPAPAHPR